MKTSTLVAAAVVASAALGVTAFAVNGNSAQEARNNAAAAAATPAVVASTPAPTTTTVEVEVTPADCLQALTDADAALALTGEGFDILGDAIEAAGNYDADSVATATQNMSLFNKRLTVALGKYRDSRDSCKAAG